MSAVQEIPTIEIDLPASLVPRSFEQDRRDACVASAHNPAERSHLLGDLAASTTLANNKKGTTILDEVLDQATTSLIDRRATPKARYHFLLTPAGEVLDIQFIETLPVDRRKEARVHAMADAVGWGPKQNRSSFRTHPERRRNHRRHAA